MLSFLFFLSVFVGSSIFLIAKRQNPISNIVAHWKDGIVVGGFNALAATFFFLSLSVLDAPTTTFLVRFSTIFIIIIGVLFLKEKLSRYDFPGMILAVFGALVINYSSSYNKLGLLIALVAALGVALHQVSAKIFVKRIDPFSLVNLRTFFSSAILLVVTFASSGFEIVPPHILAGIFLGGAVIATIGFIFMYKSFEIIDVSKAAVIRTADPFIILVYGLIFFRSIPSAQEILGGCLIVAGVALIMLKHRIPEFIAYLRKPTWFA